MTVTTSTLAALVYEMFDLQRAVRCIAVSAAHGEETGLAVQYVLRLVGEGESRATRLAERPGIGAPVLSRHIAELEEQDFVIRTKDPDDDGRAQILALTPAGAERLRRIEELRITILQERLRGWNEEDAGNTAKILHTLTKSVTSRGNATAVA